MTHDHEIDYVRVRTSEGTLARNLPAIEEALRRREAGGLHLVSTVADTHNGDLVGVLLLFARRR
jgi:hypothetical protein